jgi:uncharacterized protein YmfQ (DUF2313 family)
MYGDYLYGQAKFGTNGQGEIDPQEYFIELMQYLPTIFEGVKEMEELQKILGYETGRVVYNVKDLLNQCFVSTATLGLDRWEKVHGVPTDRSKSYEWRREILFAKIRGSGTTSKQMIRNVAIAFSGGEVVVQEFPEEYRFAVQFIGIKGIPQNMAGLINAIEEIKPAHLAYSFKYTYTVWKMLSGLTWDDVNQKTWAELKIYEEDEIDATNIKL